MKIKTILDEAMNKGEKIKSEMIHELLKSKTVHDLVTNKNFIHAVTRIIETKDEVKKVITHQVKSIFDMMEVPTKHELRKIAAKLMNLEKTIEKVGRGHIAVSVLKQNKKAPKTKKKVSVKNSKTTAAKKATPQKKAKKK